MTKVTTAKNTTTAEPPIPELPKNETTGLNGAGNNSADGGRLGIAEQAAAQQSQRPQDDAHFNSVVDVRVRQGMTRIEESMSNFIKY